MSGKFDTEFYRHIIDRIHSNVYITDIETDEIVYMNDFMKKTFHFTDPEGKKCWEILEKDQNGRCEFCKIKELTEGNDGCLWKAYSSLNERIYMKYDILEEWNGKHYHVQYSTDVTDNMELSMNAVIDELTTVLNRRGGKKRLADTLDGLRDEEHLVVCMYDINGLKWVNDTFGHREGDRLLHYVATEIKKRLKEPDFIFRLSGDEFIIVFDNVEIYQADNWMKEALHGLEMQRRQAGFEYEVSFSYALVKIRGKNRLGVSDVLGLADTEMYLQKRDYHIEQARKRVREGDHSGREEKRKFEYNKDSIFEAFSETVEGYAFAGNLKTGEFMYSNKMVREFGLPRQILSDAAAFWGDLIHPEDRELFLRSNQEIADGKSDRHTIFYRAKNTRGKWVHLLCKGRMTRDKDGNPDLFAGVIRNLDEAERHGRQNLSAQSSFHYMQNIDEKEQLDLEEALLTFVNRHIPGGIIAMRDDRDLSIVCFNQTLIEYMGYTHEDFMRRSGGKFRGLIYEQDRESVLDDIQRQLSQKDMYETHYRIIRNDGTFAWIYDVGKYNVDENGERYIFSFLMDVTEDIEKTQELRFINENSSSGVFKAYLNEKFEITYVNEGFYRVYGYTKEELERGKEFDLSGLLEKEDAKALREKVMRAAEAGENQLTLEYKVKKGNGSVGWAHADCNITMQEDGSIIMIGIIMDITERHLLEEQVHQTEQIYQFIGNYTKLDVWEYNLRDNILIVHDVKDGIYQNGREYHNIPEGLIQGRNVLPESAEALYGICEKIRSGEENAVTVIQVCMSSGKSAWKKITSIAVKEEAGGIKKAIGIAEDITAQREAEIRAFEREKSREMLERDTIYSVHINLTKNRLEAVWRDREALDIGSVRDICCEDVYNQIVRALVAEDDRKLFQEEFSLEKLREYAGQDNFFQEFECRQVNREGIVIWVRMSFRILNSPTTGNKILFINARNIDGVKRRELSLQKKVELDEVTDLYNLTTTRLLIENILNESAEKRGESVFLLINIDNFREVNRVGGFPMGDELLKQAAEAISARARSFCVAGRITGDIFGIYLYNRKTSKEVRQEAEELLHSLKGSYICGSRTFEITLSGGAICLGERKLTYDFVYQCAYDALEIAKSQGGNQLVFYRDIEETEAAPEIYRRELGQILGRCLDWIKKGEAKKEVYRTLLEYIGNFYDAEEVTLFSRLPSGKCAKIVGWNAYKKGATLLIRQENIGYLFDAMKETAEVQSLYISGEDSTGYEDALKAFETDHVDYPMILMGKKEKKEKKEPEFVILVEKCEIRVRDRMIRKAMVEMVRWIEYVYRNREACREALRTDPNTGILNYESFIVRLGNMNEDTISTLGMVGVQMVDLKKYNSQYGTVKGDESLVFAAECMARIFGRKNCYRVGRTSFFAVCENMAYEQFMESHRRLERELEESYYEWIVTSSAWEQAAISAEKMRGQIEEKLSVARNKKKNGNAASEKAVMEIQEDIQELINQGQFCAFLQPKAEAGTGKVCGAEALIRLYDANRGIVPPGRFLPAIERAGLIRQIDLFVLKEVCRTIREWLEEGWKPFPISLNYSRMTILEPDILEETNRIVERFGIPKELIEIEITESIGSIDSISLKNIVKKFSQSGYRIALDDYGAEYSNVYILYSLQLDTLKLDRRIVNDVYHDMKARVIVESVIDVCRKFHIKCVAEGVETKEHLDVLREMGCDIIQGYYLNKPLPAEEFHEYYIEG